MKKFICTAIFAMCALMCINVYAQSEWTKEYTEQVQRGVVYKYILKYSGGSFTKLHIVECDLTDPSVSVGIMTASGGSSALENTKKMAEQNGAVVAVNGDFFNMKSKPTNMLGMVFQDGELVSTPSKDLWATFAVTDTGKVLMDYFGFSGKVISPQGYEMELYQVNKEAVTGGAVNMFTKKWGQGVYCGENMQAMLIKDGHVTQKISQPGDVAFGDNDKIMLTNYTVNGFFDNFNVGDEVKYEYSITGCDENIAEATGGNTLLVKDGKRASFTNVSSGYAQRTAAGMDASGTKLILAVCDGRQTNCKGMTQEMMADAMIELGCVRAVNFDGGGSSTLVTRDEISDTVDVKNQVSSLRNVSTSVGIFNKSDYVGDVAGGVVKLGEDVVLKGDYTEIYYKFHDSNYHTVYPEKAEDVVISSDDAAFVSENGRVYFNTGGKHKVYATFEGVTAETEVLVIDDVASCYIYPENLTLQNGGTASVSLTVRDSDGNKAYVHADRVKWVSDGASINNGIVSGASGYVGAEFDNASAYCSVNGAYAPKNRAKKTAFMTGKKDNAKVIRISAGSEKYTSIANMVRTLNYEYSLGGAERLFMFNAPLIRDLSYSSADAYSQSVVEGTLFVTVDSSSGGINKNGQLGNIAKLPESYEKNIVIITKNPPSGYPEDEKNIFFDCVKKAQDNGKNVFIVYEDSKTRSFVENGIYYITCAAVKSAGLPGGEDYYDREKTAEFYLSAREISYDLIN